MSRSTVKKLNAILTQGTHDTSLFNRLDSICFPLDVEDTNILPEVGQNITLSPMGLFLLSPHAKDKNEEHRDSLSVWGTGRSEPWPGSCSETAVNLKCSNMKQIGTAKLCQSWSAMWHGQTVNNKIATQYLYGPATHHHPILTLGAVPD